MQIYFKALLIIIPQESWGEKLGVKEPSLSLLNRMKVLNFWTEWMQHERLQGLTENNFECLIVHLTVSNFRDADQQHYGLLAFVLSSDLGIEIGHWVKSQRILLFKILFCFNSLLQKLPHFIITIMIYMNCCLYFPVFNKQKQRKSYESVKDSIFFILLSQL